MSQKIARSSSFVAKQLLGPIQAFVEVRPPASPPTETPKPDVLKPDESIVAFVEESEVENKPDVLKLDESILAFLEKSTPAEPVLETKLEVGKPVIKPVGSRWASVVRNRVENSNALSMQIRQSRNVKLFRQAEEREVREMEEEEAQLLEEIAELELEQARLEEEERQMEIEKRLQLEYKAIEWEEKDKQHVEEVQAQLRAEKLFEMQKREEADRKQQWAQTVSERQTTANMFSHLVRSARMLKYLKTELKATEEEEKKLDLEQLIEMEADKLKEHEEEQSKFSRERDLWGSISAKDEEANNLMHVLDEVANPENQAKLEKKAMGMQETHIHPKAETVAAVTGGQTIDLKKGLQLKVSAEAVDSTVHPVMESKEVDRDAAQEACFKADQRVQRWRRIIRNTNGPRGVVNT